MGIRRKQPDSRLDLGRELARLQELPVKPYLVVGPPEPHGVLLDGLIAMRMDLALLGKEACAEIQRALDAGDREEAANLARVVMVALQDAIDALAIINRKARS